MSEPLSVVAKIASTPEQAKLFVALLRAEGIPAYIHGSSAPDEFSMSQRMMNLIGTKVMVPTASLQRAQELLEAESVDIDAAELERQALEARDDPDAESES